MPEVTSYAPGVPSWLDLATPDPAAAEEFYAALFGWTYDDQPAGDDDETYTMVRKDGKDVAGLMRLSDEMAASGMPPVWTSYVTVADLDATCAAVTANGGAVMRPPMDVMDAGRMAVVADPAGAAFCLWVAKGHIGAQLQGEHGSRIWNELMTPDPAAVIDFYRAVLGWRAETQVMEGGPEYTVFFVEGGSENGIAGCMAPPMPGMPAAWGIYFAVDDCDATVATAASRGATVLAEPIDLATVGRMAALMDPQGAAFSLLQPEMPSA